MVPMLCSISLAKSSSGIRKRAQEIGLAAYADLLQDGGKLGPRRRDLDAEGASALAQGLTSRQRRGKTAFGRRQAEEFGKVAGGERARLRVGDEDHRERRVMEGKVRTQGRHCHRIAGALAASGNIHV